MSRRDHRTDDRAERIASRVLSLPMHPFLSDDELGTIVSAVVAAAHDV